MNVKKYSETRMMKTLKEKSWKDTQTKTYQMAKDRIQTTMITPRMVQSPLPEVPVEVDLYPLQRVAQFTADQDLPRVQWALPCPYIRAAQTAVAPPPLHTVSIRLLQHTVDLGLDHQHLGGVAQVHLHQDEVALAHIGADRGHLPRTGAGLDR